MEFSGQYLTYQEYKTLGGTLDEMPFNLLEYNARKEIDKPTFKRLVEKGNEYQEVKLCVYDLIAILNSYKAYETQNKAISSESTDGYNVSYETPQMSVMDTKNNEIANVIETHLSELVVDEVPALYRGADVS